MLSRVGFPEGDPERLMCEVMKVSTLFNRDHRLSEISGNGVFSGEAAGTRWRHSVKEVTFVAGNEAIVSVSTDDTPETPRI